MPRTIVSMAAAVVLLVFAAPASAAPAVQVVRVAAGGSYSCVLGSDTKTYCWGGDDFGQRGDGNLPEPPFGGAVRVNAPTGVTFVQLAAGAAHACGLGDDGRAYCWGSNSQGQLGTSDQQTRPSPVPVNAPPGVTFTQLAASVSHTCGLTGDGIAYCWGIPNIGRPSGASEGTLGPLEMIAPAGVTFTQLAVGAVYACGLARTGRAYCWGTGGRGQLGDGDTVDRPSPTPVTMPPDVKFTQITTGITHACGLSGDGQAYCWGNNADGQLGVGDTGPRTIPVPVTMPAWVTFNQLTAGYMHTCGLARGGRAYCWGNSGRGQVGDGSTTSRSVPTLVHAPAGVAFTELTTGILHTCGRAGDGTAYCWGRGDDGRLGNGGGDDQLSPVKVLPLGVKPAGPQPPATVTATAGDQQIQVSWTPSSDLGDGTPVHYLAFVAPGDQTCTSSSAPTCTIAGLYNGTAYTVSVVSVTTVGNSAVGKAPAAVTPDAVPDNSGPTVTVTPGDRALVRGGQFVTAIEAVDPAGISGSYLDGPDRAALPGSYTRATVASGADGSRTVTWVVFDNRGNPTTTSRTVIVDNTPPTVAFRTAPRNGTKISKPTTFTATATDRNGIARVQLLVNGTPVATAASRYAFALRPARYGKQFTVQLRAYDRAGNVRTTNRLTYRR
ncbi:Ig-like domain-containing protein [Actinoplanes sp. HUAS TT8]|uniref:RCC1 domain-containing protein n=1 Tax=Actinoplanes sp. HUAS TT8 TaxID=3447453 RepID=UPI003F51BD21